MVAPIISDPDDRDIVDARKGKKPLHLYLHKNGMEEKLADMQKAVSIHKSYLKGRELIQRYAEHDSDDNANDIRERISVAFCRFPFPDEVHPVFKELKDKIFAKFGTESHFGKVIDMFIDILVESNDWMNKGRTVNLIFILPAVYMNTKEDGENVVDSPSVEGLNRNEKIDNLDLSRVCELLLGDKSNSSAMTLLWNRFQVCIQKLCEKVIENKLDPDEISDLFAEVVSEDELTYERFKNSKSLQLNALCTRS